ncbi:MAG: response regulator transcription factor [Anaerolineales bacterium]
MSNTEIPWLADAATLPLLDIYDKGAHVSRMESLTRVLIADSRARVRFGLRILLDKQSDVEVVGEVDKAGDLIEEIRACCADLVLVDWGLPGLEDGSLIEALLQACPDTKLIVLSGRPEVKEAAMQAGADAFVNKTETPVHLLSVIKDCCHRDTYSTDKGEV